MSDRNIDCQDCSNPFVFTEQEQAFYSEKGFTDPKRCKPCRNARKDRQGGGGGGNDRPQRSQQRDDRQMFDATCADCNQATQVPFEPRGDRPVYCRECFKNHAPTRR